MKKLIVCFLICAAGAVSAHAQSLFLAKGQNGFGVNAGYSTTKDGSAFSGAVGYSYYGILDLGLSAGRAGLNGTDLNATTMTPFTSLFIIKQGEKIPVSLSLDASYHRDISSKNDRSQAGNFYTLGFSLSSTLGGSEVAKMQPIIGYYYITDDLKIRESGRFFPKSDGEITMFVFGLSLIFPVSHENSIVVTPSISFTGDVPARGISLSFILP